MRSGMRGRDGMGRGASRWTATGAAGALLLALSAAPLAAQDQAAVTSRAADPRLSGADLFNIAVAADPQISPDGRQIAYVRRQGDIMTDRMRGTIWLVDAASGRQQPLAAGPGSHGQPRWSPDGSRLAYVSTAEGGGAQLYVRWMASGVTARLTGMADSPSDISWSPDGSRIAYLMRVPGKAPSLGKSPAKPDGASWAPPLEVIDAFTYRSDAEGYLKPGFDQLFLIAADGGAPRQISHDDYPLAGPLSWTPDGRSIVLTGNRRPDWDKTGHDPELYEIALADGAVRQITDRRGPDRGGVVSPDGRLIAFTGFDDTRKSYQRDRVYLINRDGSGRRALTDGIDLSFTDLRWAEGGRALMVRYDKEGVGRIGRLSLDGRLSEVASNLQGAGLDRPYSGGSYSLARDGSVAATIGDPHTPADVGVLRGGSMRRLTRLNGEWLAGKRLAEVRALPVRHPDGTSVPSWIALPPDYRAGQKVPLILEIHGGPHTAYGPTFATDVQLYAAAGYAVLYTNPRGSTSYGDAFANAIDKSYPGVDEGDLMAAVDAAIAAGYADPDNLFVTGGSGGGVLTTWLVGKSNRFRAAAAQKPVINWISEALTMDNSGFTSRYWFDKEPWEDPMSYWRRSPLSLIGSINTPTLVVVGSEDYRTPVSESEQLYTALRIKGVPSMLVKVPGASHGGFTARPSQSAAKAAAILAWFDRYRKR